MLKNAPLRFVDSIMNDFFKLYSLCAILHLLKKMYYSRALIYYEI